MHSIAVSASVLLLGLLITAVAVYWEYERVLADDHHRFRQLEERVKGELVRKVVVYHYGLVGARSLFPGSNFVERDEFRAMVNAHRIETEFPGALGIGFIKRVKNSPEAMEAFLQRTRADGEPDFQVRIPPGAAPMPGVVNDDRLIIEYIEPLEANRDALGLDIGAHPLRREAAQRAMLTGKASITGCIQLVSGTQQVAGFLYLLPVYTLGMPLDTAEQRTEAIFGWVYMPMLGPDVFRGATDVTDGELDVEVFDGREPTLRNLFFDADGHLERAGTTQQVPRAMQSWSELEVGGRPWTVSISASDHFEFVSRGPLLILLCSGCLLAVLASFLVYNQSTAAMRAKALAMSMTDDLRRLAMVAEHTTNAVLITDRNGGIVWTNKGFSQMTGLHFHDVRGRLAVGVMCSAQPDATTVHAMRAAFTSGTSYRGHVQGRRADGVDYWADANIEPIHGENTELEGFVVVESDITEQVKERERAESTLREVEGLWNTIDTHSIVSISDSHGRIEDVNEAFCKISGYTRDELVGKDHRLINAGYHNASFWRDLWATVRSGKTWRGEICNRAKDGSIFWVDSIITPFHDSADQIEKYVSIRQDITDRKLAEEELRVAARTDKLTGLPNRALFNDRLQQAVLRGERNKDFHFAVLFLDFDRFKLINDSLGHNVGDQLLQAIATRLRNAVRSVDTAGIPHENTAARLGGDEFVVLLDGLYKPDDAVIVAERLLEAFAAPYTLGEHEVYSSASIGVVTSETGGGSAEAILRDADTAMYEAKLAGKGRYVVFDVSMRQRVQQRMNVERDLRRVLETDQLLLHYQPIVNLRTGEVHSVEALIRWNHPERGMVSPADFIPVAEDTGLIVPIGEWVLREACSQFAQWQREMGGDAPASISVNLSRVQLMLHNLPQTISEILAETGVAPSCLHLEVTESAVMKDTATGVRLLRAIKEIGVQIDLDDFGTGYSSLASLHQFPIDVLKIDRSFIANINRGRDFAALVYAVSQLARNLNISVVAEGIETMEQAAVLLSLDYDLGQGYLFSKPLPAAKVPTFRVRPELLRSAHDIEPFSAA